MVYGGKTVLQLLSHQTRFGNATLIWQSRSLINIQQKAPLLETFDILNVVFKGLNYLVSNY